MAEADVEVLMLDARARLAPRALDGIRRCAASDPSIGTITPVAVDPASNDPDAVSDAIHRAAVPVYPEITAGATPCIAVRRGLLRHRGEGVAQLRSRAHAEGFRNVLCDDACVLQPGGSSANEPLGPIDTIGPVRRMVRSQLALLGQEGKPGVLHVVHPRGGGTEKYIRELIDSSSGEYRHYFLRIYPDRWLFRDAADRFAGSYAWPRDEAGVDCLRAMCSWLRIGVVHVHSLVGSGDDFPRILDAASLPYCYSVHDMFLPCPAVYLINSAGEYCNANTDPVVCRRCLSGFPSLRDIDIVRWRARYGAFLDRATRVYAPSHWAGETLRKYYPGIRLTVAAHRPQAAPGQRIRDDLHVLALPDDECRHVGVLGAIGPEKGARQIDALASRIRERRLPLRLVVIGYTDQSRRLQSDDRVLTVHGRYRQDEIEALFDAYRIGLVAFPTIWPETFSYTLGEAWMVGRPALVPPRGALMERVVATGAGWIMEGWPDIDALADQLLALTSSERAGELAARQELARAAFDQTVRAAAPARMLYRELLAGSEPRVEREGSRRAIYEAACRAMGFAPLPAVEPRSPPLQRASALGRLARLLRG